VKLLSLLLSLSLLLTGCVGTTTVLQQAENATIKQVFVTDLQTTSANYAAALTLPGLTDKAKGDLQLRKDCVDGILTLVQPGQSTVEFKVAGLVSLGSVADINLLVSGVANGGVTVPPACKQQVADMVLKGAGAIAPVKLLQ
jgi:hypothetical protein